MGSHATGERRISLVEVFVHRPFLVMWVAMLISTTGTFLFLMVAAAHVFEETGSSLKASLIFAAQFLLPILLASVTGRIYNKFRARSVLVSIELGCAALTLATGLVMETSYPLVIVFMTLRGFAGSVVVVGRTVTLKQTVDKRYLEKASAIIGTSFVIAMGVAGLCGSALAERLSIVQIAIVDAATFVVSASLYFTLPNRPHKGPPSRRGLWHTTRAVFRERPLLGYFSLYLFVLVGVFQGYHTIARTILPMQHLRLGVTGTTQLVALATVAIVLGSLFVFRFMTDRPRTRWQHPLALAIVTSIALPLPGMVSAPWLSFALYFVYIFLFEVACSRVRNELIVSTPHESIGPITAFTHSISTASMTVITVVAGTMIDATGLVPVTIGLAAVASGACATIAFQQRRRRSVPRGVPGFIEAGDAGVGGPPLLE